jgi:hypothetical protein
MPTWVKLAIVAGCVGLAVFTTVRRPNLAPPTQDAQTNPAVTVPPTTKPTESTGVVGSRPAQVGHSSFVHVRVGMNFAEACRTIGGPPGFYHRERHIPRPFLTPNVAEWTADDATLTLRFDPTGRVEKIDLRLAD